MATNTRSNAAVKANQTRNVRRQFINTYGQTTFDALVRIAKQTHGRKVPSGLVQVSNTSLAAYRANLTRGAYGDFVVVRNDGTWDDDMNLVNA
jgi:hypothetical protein